MEHRSLEITIQYAEDLNKVNLISKMDVYVVVSISGGDKSSKQKTRTTADHGGDANPTWRFPMKFMVEEAVLLQNRLVLDFKLKCESALGDKDIGEVHVPIKELLDSPATGQSRSRAKNFVSYQVRKPNGKPKGQLTFSYQFCEKPITTAPQPEVYGLQPSSSYPATAPPLPPLYPVSVAPAAYGRQYPPPAGYPQASGLAVEWYPPPPGCEYPPPGPSYGYPLPPPGSVYPTQLGSGYSPPPPLMQLAPNWWIVDWRYDHRCSRFTCNGGF